MHEEVMTWLFIPGYKHDYTAYPVSDNMYTSYTHAHYGITAGSLMFISQSGLFGCALLQLYLFWMGICNTWKW